MNYCPHCGHQLESAGPHEKVKSQVRKLLDKHGIGLIITQVADAMWEKANDLLDSDTPDEAKVWRNASRELRKFRQKIRM